MTIDELRSIRERIVYRELLDLDCYSDREVLTDLIDAEIERQNGCWHCRGIESHEIDHVKTYVDAYGHELGAYDVPLRHCPSCGRKLVE